MEYSEYVKDAQYVTELIFALMVTGSNTTMLKDTIATLKDPVHILLRDQVIDLSQKYKNGPFCVLVPRFNDYVDALCQHLVSDEGFRVAT